MFFSRKLSITVTTAVFAYAAASSTLAQGFGVLDPQTLGMGGTSVAIANPASAVFYNPARLAQGDQDEDIGRQGRFFFPTATVQVAGAAEDLQEIDDEDLVDEITNVINSFNAAPGTDTAQAVADASQNLLVELDDIRDQDLFLDSFAGLTISEPGDGQGGAFYWGVRSFGVGDLSSISDSDIDLLNDYVDALTFIATSGAQGEANPALFDDNGDLIDPRDSLESTAEAQALAAMEVGVSFAREFDFWGQPVAIGLTPKLLLARAYDASYDAATNDVVTSDDPDEQRKLNADFGLASQFGRFNVGLAVKDVVEQTFDTESGGEVVLEPKGRLGLGYLGERWQIGLDYDLNATTLGNSDLEIQDLTLGLQLQPWRWLAIRAGYRQDQVGNREDLVTGGLGFKFGRFVMDVAVAQSDDLLSAGLQLGFSH